MRSTDFPFAVTPRRFDKGGPSFTDRARQVAKGATFAFNDEIEARARALLTGGNYDDILRDIRAQQAAYEAANAYESAGLEIGGAFLPGLLPGGQGLAAARVASLAAKAPLRLIPATDSSEPVVPGYAVSSLTLREGGGRYWVLVAKAHESVFIGK